MAQNNNNNTNRDSNGSYSFIWLYSFTVTINSVVYIELKANNFTLYVNKKFYVIIIDAIQFDILCVPMTSKTIFCTDHCQQMNSIETFHSCD